MLTHLAKARQLSKELDYKAGGLKYEKNLMFTENVMSLSRKNNKSPGELLFLHLLSRCDTKETRNAAIMKIMATNGGIDTGKQAVEYCQPMIDKYHAEMEPLETAWLTAKYDHYITVDYGDRETGPCVLAVGVGGEAGKISDKIRGVTQKYEAIFSIYNLLTSTIEQAKRDEEIAEARAAQAAKEAEAERDLAYIQELTSKQFQQRPRN